MRPWATVLRVPVASGTAWFKACSAVQAFEPRLTVELFGRWPDRVSQVVAADEERGWLLLADAGSPIADADDASWPTALARYAELQIGEAAHADDHRAHGVPDLRLAALPARFDELVARRDLPLEGGELAGLRRLGPRVRELCLELARHGVRETIQHDDLHADNLLRLRRRATCPRLGR